MSEPYMGEIKLVSFNYAPRGWALCNGQLLSIAQNQALFSLLGTTFGGDGRVTFGLPDFRGRLPVHWGPSVVLGERYGEESHSLTIGELPTHSHLVRANSADASEAMPTSSSVLARSTSKEPYATQPTSPLMAMAPSAISSVGGSQPHQNSMPSLALHFVIALQGIYPSRN